MGLYLLSAVCACDFGWLGALDTVERLEATLGTMSRMELFRGHFYNWYDTRDLHPLEPRYVSSVDSGNLAGHLVALGNSCRELTKKSLLGARLLAGMEDATRLLGEALSGIADTRRTHTVTRKQLSNAVDRMADLTRLAARGCRGLGDIVSRSGDPTPRPWLTLRKLWRKSVQTLPNLN